MGVNSKLNKKALRIAHSHLSGSVGTGGFTDDDIYAEYEIIGGIIMVKKNKEAK
jgi:hypothetical protein